MTQRGGFSCFSGTLYALTTGTTFRVGGFSDGRLPWDVDDVGLACTIGTGRSDDKSAGATLSAPPAPSLIEAFVGACLALPQEKSAAADLR